mmetsp:Transcript_26781/g.60052  ORF Transcript_26781/g.60052 Transcript_26781/m.60052 type:complete len:191 (-) Transcript_26781:52-624(-)
MLASTPSASPRPRTASTGCERQRSSTAGLRCSLPWGGPCPSCGVSGASRFLDSFTINHRLTTTTNKMMKIIALIALINVAAAFNVQRPVARQARLSMEGEAPPARQPSAARMAAKWLPVGNTMAPKLLDGSLAADVGFDPFGLAKTKNGLYWMREAEVKHGRLAMLAAVGWPLSELWRLRSQQIPRLFHN